jgi:hypothetical protein
VVVKEKPTVGSPFSWEFSSERIPKVMNDINVYFFVQSFIFVDELIMDNAVAVKNSCKL